MLLATDLVRLAQLIKLAAETAQLFSQTSTDGVESVVTSATKRILTAADELIEAGYELEKETKAS